MILKRWKISRPKARVLLAALLLPLATSSADAQGNGEKPKQDNAPRLEIYGFVMADLIPDFDQNNPQWYDVMRPTKLPAFPDEFGENGRTQFSVRQTRFGAKAWLPTPIGDVKTIFEWELFGVGEDAGQTTFRLRHAYAQLGDFGAGQYWSPFMDVDVFPNSLEYWGPSGMVFFRNIQFRYMPVQGDSRVTIALERPGASGDQGQFADRIELDNVRGRFPFPDITGEGRYGGKWGFVELAGVVRWIKWDDLLIDDPFDLEGEQTGWGVNLSSNIKFGADRASTLRLQVVYGEGVQNYMNDAPADIGILLNPGNLRRPILGEALPVLGVVAFVDYFWTPKWSSTAGYSLIDIDNSNGQANDAFHRGQYALFNVVHYPFDKIMAGAEVQWGKRDNFNFDPLEDDFDVSDWRLQFSVKANYSFKFGSQAGVADK